ncbi:MAG: hypothetical protein WCJ62_11965 [Flavobacterium sp.]
MRELKVGDIVRLKKKSEMNLCADLIGKQLEIIDIREDLFVDIKVLNPSVYKPIYHYGWFMSRFELVEDENMFTTKDLKTGMVVRIKDGRLYKVMLNTSDGDIIVNTDGYLYLKDINDDLTTKHLSLSIVEIYKPKNVVANHSINLSCFTSIWKREKPIKEVTLQEIADKFGVDVESIRVKEDK